MGEGGHVSVNGTRDRPNTHTTSSTIPTRPPLTATATPGDHRMRAASSQRTAQSAIKNPSRGKCCIDRIRYAGWWSASHHRGTGRRVRKMTAVKNTRFSPRSPGTYVSRSSSVPLPRDSISSLEMTDCGLCLRPPPGVACCSCSCCSSRLLRRRGVVNGPPARLGAIVYVYWWSSGWRGLYVGCVVVCRGRGKRWVGRTGLKLLGFRPSRPEDRPKTPSLVP